MSVDIRDKLPIVKQFQRDWIQAVEDGTSHLDLKYFAIEDLLAVVEALVAWEDNAKAQHELMATVTNCDDVVLKQLKRRLAFIDTVLRGERPKGGDESDLRSALRLADKYGLRAEKPSGGE